MAPFAESECHKEERTVIQLLKLFRTTTFFAATLLSWSFLCFFRSWVKNVKREIEK
jgi:hypothetical protein